MEFVGDNPQPAALVSLETFYSLIHQTSGALEQPNDHVLNPETGLIPKSKSDPDVPATHDWDVHSNTFSFSIGFVAPISSINLSFLPTDPKVKQVFYARPMQLDKPLNSDVKITVTFDQDPTLDVKPFGIIQTVKNVPKAVYGQCEFRFSFPLFHQ
jgi:hypothetical protein